MPNQANLNVVEQEIARRVRTFWSVYYRFPGRKAQEAGQFDRDAAEAECLRLRAEGAIWAYAHFQFSTVR